jgi:hypothetical protein
VLAEREIMVSDTEIQARRKLLQKILKKSLRLREKLKYGFPFSRLKWDPMLPPEPKLVLRYSPIPDHEWQLLLLCSNSKKLPKYLVLTLTEIAEAIFLYTVKAWKQKKHGGRLNLKTMSSRNDTTIRTGGKDTWREIQITTSLVSEYEAGQKINDLMEAFVEKKYHFKVKSKQDIGQYFQYASPIFEELSVNKFIRYKDKSNIQPLVHFDKIESYLRRRLKKESRPIKCVYCKNKAFVLRDDQHFCFNPSCRVLIVRKAA